MSAGSYAALIPCCSLLLCSEQAFQVLHNLHHTAAYVSSYKFPSQGGDVWWYLRWCITLNCNSYQNHYVCCMCILVCQGKKRALWIHYIILSRSNYWGCKLHWSFVHNCWLPEKPGDNKIEGWQNTAAYSSRNRCCKKIGYLDVIRLRPRMVGGQKKL